MPPIMGLDPLGGFFMRLTISLPPDTVEKVRELADAQRRPIRNQCEYLIIKAAAEQYTSPPDNTLEPVPASART